MSLFERLQSRLARNSLRISPVSPVNEIEKTASANLIDQTSTENLNQFQSNHSEPWTNHGVQPLRGSTPTAKQTSNYQQKSRTLRPSDGEQLRVVHCTTDEIQSRRNTAVISKNNRCKTPISSFYNVSDDDDDDEDEDQSENESDECESENVDGIGSISDGRNCQRAASGFDRRSQRLRRSVDKAKAALPVDFVDRIDSNTYQQPDSSKRPSGIDGNMANYPLDDEFVADEDANLPLVEGAGDQRIPTPIESDDTL